ncbi:MAG TPA: PqiC family protein [Burkholderiales bacterium]
MIRLYALIAAMFAFVQLVGCGSSPKSNFYTLSSGAAPERSEAKAQYSVAIGPVTVPAIIDRPQIVTRSGPNQVQIAELERWAGPLRSEIPRVIAANLMQQLDGAYVYVYPQNVNLNADYQVLLEVQRFDSTLGDAVTVEVLWAVHPAQGGTEKTGRSTVREPTNGNSYDALVAAYSRALTTVSRDIAEAIRSTR